MTSEAREQLWAPSIVRSVLRHFGACAKRSLGQHFLIDRNILLRMLTIACVTPEDYVLEIGSGIGVLTRALAKQAHSVIAVEKDPKMVSATQWATGDLANVTIREGDILHMRLCDLFAAMPRERCHIVANLPYGISKLILRKLIDERHTFHSMTLMLQDEVARRLLASPGTADYGALSVMMQLYGTLGKALTVSRRCFFPQPDVDSAVVHGEIARAPCFVLDDEAFFFCVVRAAFRQRRKTLANSLTSCLPQEITGAHGNTIRTIQPPLTREQMKTIIATAGIEPNRRGESLTLEEFVRLARQLQPILQQII